MKTIIDYSRKQIIDSIPISVLPLRICHEENQSFNSFYQAFLEYSQNDTKVMLLLGDAGSGKSTIGQAPIFSTKY